MIRAQAIEDHTAETGHVRYRATTDPTGRVVCTEAGCPWEYPAPAVEQQLPIDPEANHTHDAGCDDGSRYCPTRDYEANPPTVHVHDRACETGELYCPDPDAPGSGGAESEVPVAQLALDVDPGPEPDGAPVVPPLTLRARIANVVDRHFTDKFDNDGYDDSDQNQRELVDAMHAEVGAGADWTPRVEGTAMSPAQALAFLLDLPEWSRISRLGQLLDQAELGSICYLADHSGAAEQLAALQISTQRYHDALLRIARLTSTVDQPESAEQNVIGQIASAALVHRD